MKYTFLDKTVRFLIGIVILMMISTSTFAITKPARNSSMAVDSAVNRYRQQSYFLEHEGNYQEALHYMRKCDSLLLHKTTVVLQEEKAQVQKSTKIYRMIIMLIIIDLVGLMFFFYLEKNRTYKKLVKKNIEWASQERSLEMASVVESTEQAEVTTDKDTLMAQQLMVMFEKEKIFLDDNLNINSVAQRLNSNRNVISRIINSKFQKNFAALLNEYRIKEAINLLSNEEHKRYTMQAISEMCGYKNRQVFYVAFKKETGVTPTQFVTMKLSKDFDEE